MKKRILILTAVVGALALALALTASAQGPGSWTEYSGNPVFGQGIGGPKAYYPSVLYDPDEFSGQGASAQYKMWYGTSGQQTALAISGDGINWTDQGVVMTDGYHATVEYYPDGFSGANSGDNASGSTMYYRMWYWDWPSLYSITDIGYTESPDGVNWYNYQPVQNGAVPIISGGDPWWNRGSYGPCDVLYNPSASDTGTDWTFTMYYDGTTGGDEAIGIGFSSDGITWTGYDADSDGKADPVFNGTYVSGDWDENYVSRATIIKNADDDYEMWYSGGVGAMNHGIGYATSSDGIHWTRDANNPIFHKGNTGYPGYPWRQERTYCPMVIKDGNTYKMWFAGKGSAYSIGYATVEPPPAGAGKASLYESDGFSCSGGATDTDGPPVGFVILNTNRSGDLIVQVSLKDATAKATYDIWVNQDPGACPLPEPTAPDALTTNTRGNGNAHVKVDRVEGANDFWVSVSVVGGGQMLRSTAVQLD